ncbi:AcrR family transcriptional regulator [Zhongshania antarctica]|uniref:AcrR family transcriptional regulator n=1 Tax=Zhongshania antarctica TaxID=641702 RepID=A0A840QZJ6_9GAMM|nr:TetR/AcrR family transcriptional regulator [Zhongshania antarctica]MBB5185754.1 AcrR family transcriptional regulator [Zhongshania antarctica]
MQEKRGRSKSEEKRQQIILSAGMLFVEHGFEKVSMEGIAKTAGVSKQTVYSHFGNKQQLFTAAIESKCDEYELVPEKQSSAMGCEAYLNYFCSHLASLLSSPEAIDIFRVCVREGGNTEVGELFWAAGPDKIRQRLSNYLSEQNQLGHLRIDNIDFATSQLIAMIHSEAQFRNLLCIGNSKSATELQNYAQHCVRMFLKAYQT